MITDLVRRLLADPVRKALALGVALSAWLVVQGDQQHEAQVPVQLVWGLPKGLDAVEPLPDQVGVKVRGTRTATRRAARNAGRVAVDATALRAGTHEIDLAAHPVEGLPPSVEVLGVTPSSLRISLDEHITRKVPVDVATVGDPAEGIRVREAVAEPDFVELSGPRVVVSALKRAVTLAVDVSGMSTDTAVGVGLDLPRMVRAEPPQVRVAVDLEARADQRLLTGVPLEVRGYPEWVPSIDVVDLRLEGPSQVLAGLRPDDVIMAVILPDPPRRDRYVASFGVDEGARLVAYVLGAPEVRAVEVVPAEVEVARP